MFQTKKGKIFILGLWLCLTALYCWFLSDIGHSMGVNTNFAIEAYAEMMVKYGGTTTDAEHLGSAMVDMWSYKYFDDLSKTFKRYYTVVGITTAIYFFLSLLCYHQAFVKKKKNTEKEIDKKRAM